MFIDNDFLFIKNNQIIVPIEIKEIVESIDIKKISKENKLKAIEFYLNINGMISIEKLQELLEATQLKITKKDLKEYLKELNLKAAKNYVYENEFAFIMDKEYNFSKIKESFDDYAIYTIENMQEEKKKQEEDDYVIKIYKLLKNKIKDEKECFNTASLIFDYIRLGYNLEENIQKLMSSKKIKGTQEQIDSFNYLLQETYDNTPSWELNGYYPGEKEINLSKEEVESLLSYINMYMIMNGAIKVDKLLEILTNHHHFNLTREDLIEMSKIPGDIYITNNYFCSEGIEGEILKGLIKQKEKIRKYKIINDLEKFFEEHDIIENKLKKLINKYTDSKKTTNQIISLIVLGGINELTLTITLNSNKIDLPDNKVRRMLKDLETCQKNVRIWSLNGYTMNEVLNKQY